MVEKLIENPEFEEPDNHGRNISDAGALALVYEDIDREKVKEIYTKNYINHLAKRLMTKMNQSDEEYLGGAKSAEEFVMAPRSVGSYKRPSRYDRMIERMELKNWKVDDLWLFAMSYNVNLLKQSDYEPLLAIHNNPQSWVDGKLTEEAKNAVKKAMIQSTQESLESRKQDIRDQIDGVRGFIAKVDSFFLAVDQRKKEIKQAEEIKDVSQPKQESCDRLRKVLEATTKGKTPPQKGKLPPVNGGNGGMGSM